MWIECTGCPVRKTHCDGCMVTGLLSSAPGPPRVPADDRDRAGQPIGAAGSARGARRIGPQVADPIGISADLDRRERAALTALVSAGMVTPEVAGQARAMLDLSAESLWGTGQSATG